MDETDEIRIEVACKRCGQVFETNPTRKDFEGVQRSWEMLRDIVLRDCPHEDTLEETVARQSFDEEEFANRLAINAEIEREAGPDPDEEEYRSWPGNQLW